MTDNEIIKALECCWRNANHIRCTGDCPMYEYCESDEEDEMNICGLALDLINRQKAGIEKLQKENESIRYCYETASQYIEHLAKSCNDMCKINIKSEAIKEFAERLKEKAGSGFWQEHSYVDVEDIDNLVKEMTESEESYESV